MSKNPKGTRFDGLYAAVLIIIEAIIVVVMICLSLWLMWLGQAKILGIIVSLVILGIQIMMDKGINKIELNKFKDVILVIFLLSFAWDFLGHRIFFP